MLLPGRLVEVSPGAEAASASDLPEPSGGHEGLEEEYLRWWRPEALREDECGDPAVARATVAEEIGSDGVERATRQIDLENMVARGERCRRDNDAICTPPL